MSPRSVSSDGKFLRHAFVPEGERWPVVDIHSSTGVDRTRMFATCFMARVDPD